MFTKKNRFRVWPTARNKETAAVLHELSLYSAGIFIWRRHVDFPLLWLIDFLWPVRCSDGRVWALFFSLLINKYIIFPSEDEAHYINIEEQNWNMCFYLLLYILETNQSLCIWRVGTLHHWSAGISRYIGYQPTSSQQKALVYGLFVL